MPGRRFPGIVIQGDTLWTLLGDAEEIVTDLERGGDAAASARYLVDRLTGFLGHYERTLADHNIPLPYFRDVAH